MASRHTRKTVPPYSRVAIIGGSISGLAAAKQLAAHDPVVFEATQSVGGVWKHCAYRSTRLQTPRRNFRFSDHPWADPEGPVFPAHDEVVEYLESYADRFGLWRFIMLGARVVGVNFLGKVGGPLQGEPMWEVGVATEQSDTIQYPSGLHGQWYKFEFVVMCMGKYGDVPRMPVFPPGKGTEAFKGKVMHSLDYCKLSEQETLELVRGKKVVVVGYRKSAIDLALECAVANKGERVEACTMLVRTPQWMLPSYSIWGLPFFLFYSTRFSQLLYDRPNQGLFRSFLCRLMTPLKAGVSKFIELYLTWKLPLSKYGLKPPHPFVESYASCQMAILPDGFFDMADRGLIRFKRVSSGWCFSENGVVLEDGTEVEADLVFLATGFEGLDIRQAPHRPAGTLPWPRRQQVRHDPALPVRVRRYHMLSSVHEHANKLFDTWHLLRFLNCSGTIHPLIPGMAFVGYVESVSNLHTSELRCRWLAGLLEGRFALPGAEAMAERVDGEAEAMRRTTRFFRRHCISTFSIHDSDGMCADLGVPAHRKGSWFAELFAPYNNQDYKEE
ncbi:unnamed protein product [Urochloa decumbens]|uniref:Flavin-containing monooxygenase n=1 Tax=Urochloa decumbens TaxID=240449 RepID=A0ABC9GSP5_9POAL